MVFRVNQSLLSANLQSKLAAIMAKFIIHAPRQRSPFTRAALKTVLTHLPLFFFFFLCKLLCFNSFPLINESDGKHWSSGTVYVET